MPSALSRSVTSNPERSPSWTSRRTTSGRRAPAAWMAPCPSSDSPITSNPSLSSRSRAKDRKIGWSSTISTDTAMGRILAEPSRWRQRAAPGFDEGPARANPWTALSFGSGGGGLRPSCSHLAQHGLRHSAEADDLHQVLRVHELLERDHAGHDPEETVDLFLLADQSFEQQL